MIQCYVRLGYPNVWGTGIAGRPYVGWEIAVPSRNTDSLDSQDTQKSPRSCRKLVLVHVPQYSQNCTFIRIQPTITAFRRNASMFFLFYFFLLDLDSRYISG